MIKVGHLTINSIKDLKSFDNYILIAPLFLMKYINELKEASNPINIKIIAKEECIESLYLTYDEKAVCYLIDKYGVSINQALNDLNLIKLLIDDNINLQDTRFKTLNKYKEELLKNGYLTKEKDFYLNFSKKRKIIVFDIVEEDKEFDLFIKSARLSSVYEKKIIITPQIEGSKVNVFNDIDEELSYIFNEIGQLQRQKVDFKDISILSLSKDYNYSINNYAKHFNLEMACQSQSLLSYPSIKYIYNLLETDIFDNICEKAESIYKDENNKLAIMELKSIVKKEHLEIKNNTLRVDTIKYLINKGNIETGKSNNGPSFLNSIIVLPTKYCFVVGFNAKNYPQSISDDLLLNENDIDQLSQNSLKHKQEKNINQLNIFLGYKGIVSISFSSSVGYNGISYISHLVTENKMVQVNVDTNYSLRYSKYADKLKYCKIVDKKRYYGLDSLSNDSVKSMYQIENSINNLRETCYSFDNSHKGIFSEPDKKYNYSYSMLSAFFECPFKYFANEELNLKNEEKPNFSLKLGTLIHDLLESRNNADFDFDKYFNISVSKLEFDNSELVFLDRIKFELGEFFRKYGGLEIKIRGNAEHLNIHNELKLVGKISDDIAINGKLDVIYESIDEDSKSYLSIVDFKSGSNFKTFFNLANRGLFFQLLMYGYLVNGDDRFKNSNIVSLLYMPSLYSKGYSVEPEKSSNVRNKHYVYNGFYNLDLTQLVKFLDVINDNKRGNAVDLKSCKIKVATKELSPNHKQFSTDELLRSFDSLREYIIKANNNMKNGNYPILPVKFDGIDVSGRGKPVKCIYDSCTNCNFGDICYHQRKQGIRFLEDYINFHLKGIKKNV